MTQSKKARRTTKTGLPGGSLIYVGPAHTGATTLQVIDYDAEHLQDIPSETLANCVVRKDAKTITWINVDGLQDVGVVQKIGAEFQVHPLALEDILNTETRPKIDDYENQLFAVIKMLSWDEKTSDILSEQIGLVLGPRYLLTFQEKGGDVFDPVRERLRTGRGRMRKSGADYLMYALLDAVVDNYFIILEKLGDQIEALETELTENPSTDVLRRLHRLKRRVIGLRHAAWPMREVLGALGRNESALVHKETRVFMRDVYDHTVQVVESVETFRDLLSGMLDIYMSTLNNRMNNVMKVLTMIATIFIPLTFIAGIYGMNFEHMPELRSRWGYPAVMGVMFAIGLAMVVMFKRRGWF